MWGNELQFDEDENEAVLIDRFVELSSLYPEHSIFEIANAVFVERNLRDAHERSNQAAMVWSRSISIQERIRQAKINGAMNVVQILTKEQRLIQLQQIAENLNEKAEDRLKAHRLIAEIVGDIQKPGDKRDAKRRSINLNIGKYED